jgi:hypothetical protein
MNSAQATTNGTSDRREKLRRIAARGRLARPSGSRQCCRRRSAGRPQAAPAGLQPTYDDDDIS